ncbi:FAD-binding domain [Microbacterium luticocti]|uniref:FAD-binding domain n=1 Tax=Microbacterium luticocti TaxID=451764 RepID=UPI00048C1D31|nr:FAD-binding domain [Microbacterium luticocti]
MRVLIVGAGIAGPTLAYWLRRTGHDVTLVERAPRLREGGYVVDFWGAGFEVAERIGIVPRLRDEGYRFREAREVGGDGRRIAHFDPQRVIDGAAGRYVTIGRSDLSRAIYDALDGDVETIFGDTVAALADDGGRVGVTFQSGAEREFDLVVGADGLHSRVRALAFGPEREFERHLDIAVAAFDIDGYRPRDELVAVMHTEVGAQALRIALRDGATMFCIMFRHEGELPVDDVTAQQDLLRERLTGFGWEMPQILAQLPQARTFYMDGASQMLMPSWSRGRIALVGDAAACPSLLAGQGSALAMVEAYVLACALAEASGDHRAAFADYENRLAGLVRRKQDGAVGLSGAFVPRNRMMLLLRNAVFGLMGVPFIENLAIGRSLRDPIELPPVPAG